MAASVHDHAPLAGLFDTGEVARLFSANADIRALMLVEGTLAKVQGAAGVIPELSAAALHRAALELQIDPGGLSSATAQNGVCVPALVAAFRESMNAPEHAQYLHWGATSQDIIDTGLMLRLRQAIALISQDTANTLRALGTLADTHASTPMAARTYGQMAAPTSFGALIASWGEPLLSAHSTLQSLPFPAALSGAVGTGTALGPDPAALRKSFAETLGLTDPGRAWHTDRTPVLDIATALARVTSALSKMGQDLISYTQTDVAEITLGGGGASSTMPQKQNPVGPSALVALGHTVQGNLNTLHTAATHNFQRDGAAWFTEWMVLPQIILGAAAAAKHATQLAANLKPNESRMLHALGGDGLLFSEALSFALADTLGRPAAQAAVKTLAQRVRTENTSLQALALNEWPDLDPTLFDARHALGTAPAEAQSFAARASAL